MQAVLGSSCALDCTLAHLPPKPLLSIPASSLTTSLPFKLSDSGNFHFFLPFLSSQIVSRLQCFSTTQLRNLGWPGCDCSMAPLLPPLLWATPLACNVSFQTVQLWYPSNPQLLMIDPTFIRFGLLRVSLRSVGAALGPCDLSVNAFTIFRSTCCSFENPAVASSDSNAISNIHTPLAFLPGSPRLMLSSLSSVPPLHKEMFC